MTVQNDIKPEQRGKRAYKRRSTVAESKSVRVMRVDVGTLDIPSESTYGAVGFDLRSAINLQIAAGAARSVPTGFVWEIPANHVGLIVPRPGLAIKDGVTVAESPGIIDCDYHSEVSVTLKNDGPMDFSIYIGDIVARVLIMPVLPAKIEEVEEFG